MTADVDVPKGELGEIIVGGGLQQAFGYLNADGTIERLAADGHHTGDLGRIDEDGHLVIVGRKKDLIIRGGVNIAPLEIDAVLHENSRGRRSRGRGRAGPDLWGRSGRLRRPCPGRLVVERRCPGLLSVQAPGLQGSEVYSLREGTAEELPREARPQSVGRYLGATGSRDRSRASAPERRRRSAASRRTTTESRSQPLPELTAPCYLNSSDLMTTGTTLVSWMTLPMST